MQHSNNPVDILDEVGPPPRQRHGCVTAWLSLMILFNSITALVYFFKTNWIISTVGGNASRQLIFLLGIVAIANVAFALLLFRWKRVGFFGFILSSLLALGVNLAIGYSIGQCLAGLIGIILLYAILQIKQGGFKAWEHLE